MKKLFWQNKSLIKIILKYLAILAAVFVFFSIALILTVYWRTNHFRHSKTDDFDKQKIAIIFGARIYSNGSLSPFLRDRVDGGIKLYNDGKVSKLLMSGDNHYREYNEVAAMQKYALEQGVPKEAIVLDYAGFSTYETCYRAKEIFGVEKAILVTQDYHEPRAVFTCRKLGIDATGYGQPDWARYRDVMPKTVAREYLAQIKMFIDLFITNPLPTFLGKKEYIN